MLNAILIGFNNIGMILQAVINICLNNMYLVIVVVVMPVLLFGIHFLQNLFVKK